MDVGYLDSHGRT